MATKKIGKGKALEELVKGSLNYAMEMICKAFYAVFPYDEMQDYSIHEIFADHLIVRDWRSNELKSDEYWKVMYSQTGESFTFTPREQWEVVELTYQPQTTPLPSASSQFGESTQVGGKKTRKQRFEERVDALVQLEEADGAGKKRRIKIQGAMTAGIINGNGRRYPASVIESAVAELRSHLNESAGQGRAVQVLGEAEHPSDKGGRPNLLETVVKWEDVTFNGARVDVTGSILETSKGKDILTLMEGGVMPGVSLRGYGDGKQVKDAGGKVFEVSELHITGFDLVLEPSFQNAAEFAESTNQPTGEYEMLEELKKLLAEHPELFSKGMTESQLEALGEKQLKKLEESLRSKLGIGADADIAKALDESMEKARKFDESQKKAGIESAIAEATKDLPFGKELNEAFTESIKDGSYNSAEDVKTFAESQRKVFGKLAAKNGLQGKGFNGGNIQMLGDVLENETGTPEFARASFELNESLRKQEMRPVVDLRKREDRAALFALQVLNRFDEINKHHLLRESQMIAEGATTSDFNLPYSVSRNVIAEAFPSLVALNVFDVGLMTSQSERIYYEAFAGETGYSVNVTDEAITLVNGSWVDLANKNIVPGTFVLTDDSGTPTYTEGTDYVVDYELGKIKMISATNISTNLATEADYTYHATRKGENVAIERAKTTLSYQTVEAAADRLADYITDEAIKYSASQLNWNAVTRMMANLIRQMRLDKDKVLIEKAIASALSVSSNSGGTWDISDADYGDLVEKLGVAAVKVANRYYEPTAILCSLTNADRLSNWDGLKRDGFPDALMTAAGFRNMAVKGLPVFGTTQMRDNWFLVINREIVMHRIYSPMTMKGPYPIFSDGKLVAGEQYYAEEYNASISPIGGKASYVLTQA